MEMDTPKFYKLEDTTSLTRFLSNITAIYPSLLYINIGIYTFIKLALHKNPLICIEWANINKNTCKKNIAKKDTQKYVSFLKAKLFYN